MKEAKPPKAPRIFYTQPPLFESERIVESLKRCETDTQIAAMHLLQAGLNVFPIPYRSKGGTVWKFMQYIRLVPEFIPKAFPGKCNIAAMTGRTSGNLFVVDAETD